MTGVQTCALPIWRRFAITADHCAQAIVDGVEKEQRTVVTPRTGWLLIALARLLPWPVHAALSRKIGLRGASDSHGPRLHDMRHVFATNTLVHWYQSDQDPERLLPILSAYLGHVHVEDTQWYLSGSPELMREAMRRLEQRWEDRP